MCGCFLDFVIGPSAASRRNLLVSDLTGSMLDFSHDEVEEWKMENNSTYQKIDEHRRLRLYCKAREKSGHRPLSSMDSIWGWIIGNRGSVSLQSTRVQSFGTDYLYIQSGEESMKSVLVWMFVRTATPAVSHFVPSLVSPELQQR